MKTEKPFTGNGHQLTGDLYSRPKPIGDRIICQLPDPFTRRQFMQAVCDRGLSYDYGWNLILDLIRSQAIVCTAPDEFRVRMKLKEYNNQAK